MDGSERTNDEPPPSANRTPIRYQDLPSRPGVTPFRKVDTDRRGFGRLPGDCFGRRNLVNRRSWPRAVHPRSSPRQMFGRWLTFQSPPGRSARKCVVPVRMSTIVRSPAGLPSSFPSGTPPCSRTGTRHPRCDTSRLEGPGLFILIHRSISKIERLGGETHDEVAALAVDILLQRSLAPTSDTGGMSSAIHKPDNPSSRRECPQPDCQVYRHS